MPDDALPVSWPGLAELVSTGLGTIGSHTHTHRLLDRVDRATAAAEIDQSIALIEDRLAVPCRHFAYPKAVLGNADAQAEVRARFDSAALAGGTANPWRATDVYRLARTPVQVADGGVWFRRKAQGGCGWRRGCGTGSIGTATPAESLDSVSTAASLRRLGSYPTRSVLCCHRDRTASR